jgi:hypothetical protein
MSYGNTKTESKLKIHKKGTQLPHSVATTVKLLIQTSYERTTVMKANEDSYEYSALSSCLQVAIFQSGGLNSKFTVTCPSDYENEQKMF